MRDVGKEDDQGADQVDHHHEGDDLLRDGGDTLQAADDDQAGQDQQHHAGDPGGNAKDCVHVAGDGVDLGHVADAKGGQEAEDGEQNGQDLANALAALLGAQAVLEVVHGAAGPLVVLVLAAVVDTQDVLGVVGHHAEEGNEPHPEHGAGAAYDDGAADAYNVAGTHCGCQRGTQ